MKKNMGSTDRFIRIFIAIALFTLFFTNVVQGTIAYILVAIACVLIFTTFINFCPLYTLMGINTCNIKK